MSNALAIAGVTAVIKDLLDSGLIDHAITDTLGAGVTVTTQAPDTVSLDSQVAPQLNLFLHQVTPNVAWRNAALPSRDAGGIESATRRWRSTCTICLPPTAAPICKPRYCSAMRCNCCTKTLSCRATPSAGRSTPPS